MPDLYFSVIRSWTKFSKILILVVQMSDYFIYCTSLKNLASWTKLKVPHTPISVYLEPQNVILFRNKIFVGVIN